MPKSTIPTRKPAPKHHKSLKPGGKAAPAYHIVCMPKAIDPETQAQQIAAILAYLRQRKAHDPDEKKTVAGNIPIVTADICCESYDAFRRAAARYGVYVYPNNPNRNRSNKRYETECVRWNERNLIYAVE